ncbi:MAG: hypothetical protein LKG25_04505 [Prevotella sp.]|nr:hypothetical protein [Prevotella sp.]MCI1281836.1 hypothetical protein [Prevotella sp.]
MGRKMLLCLIVSLWASQSWASPYICKVQPSGSDLLFKSLASTWDEGMPLGNAVVGELVWQKGERLHFSLDRTDLWDLRATDSLSGPDYNFEWVKQHIARKDYAPVQAKFDRPYDELPAPSKIPGAALEFNSNVLGKVVSNRLYLHEALCRVGWSSGATLETFVLANRPVGWFVFHHVPASLEPEILMPAYQKTGEMKDGGPVSGLDLQRLGYQQGKVTRTGNTLSYHQQGYGGFSYDVVVSWKRVGDSLYGVWSISSSLSQDKAERDVKEALQRGLKADFQQHIDYWYPYWKQSSISIPDTLLQRQYDREIYKFGSSSRKDSYPISLQAVWTADNGHLPPWKGDYHHDLNTQLSYWPAYIGNHLNEEMGYLNTLWNQRDVYKKYTREFFGKDGMDIPGVCTLDGKAMGGWMQYSLSQTVGAWLSQYFYLHWKYSADREFLKNRAYPFIKDVATFLEQQTTLKDGIRTLDYSTSPEINDNSLEAWFPTITNYDLGLIRFNFKAAEELADDLGLSEEAQHWKKLSAQLPDYDLDAEGALTFAHGHPYNVSHRHFSNLMAFHPLGLIDWSHGEKDQSIIKATLEKLHQVGPDWWCGYSYSWLGNLEARAFHGQEAYEALTTFAKCFCLKNSFHANGDQTKSGKSKFTYRPFTLEGNFAFAAGIQEMLMQSHTGIIHVFPAVPSTWKDVSFRGLRAMGAFLVTAQRKAGKVVMLKVYSEKGGTLKIQSPVDGKVLTYPTKANEWITII